MTESPLYIITGTSGTGKTAVIEALKQRGHLCFDEPVRQLLQDQLAVDGPALPAKNPLLFVQTLQLHFQHDYLQAQATGWATFFDRGWPDSLAYAARFGLEVQPFEVTASEWRYHETVFVTPPWREIFRNDPEGRGVLNCIWIFTNGSPMSTDGWATSCVNCPAPVLLSG